MWKWWSVQVGDNNELIPIGKEKSIASNGGPQLCDSKQYNTKEKMTIRLMLSLLKVSPSPGTVGLAR